MKPNYKRSALITLAAALYILPTLLACYSIFFAVSKNPSKGYFGYRFFAVLTESMTPTVYADGSRSLPGGFYQGDMIIVKMAPPESLQVNDIITFTPSAASENTVLITHRVVNIMHEQNGAPGLYFQTKGDHNEFADPVIPADQMLGKVVGRLPLVGMLLRGMGGRIAGAVVLLLLALASLVAAKRVRRRAKGMPKALALDG